MEPFPGVRWTTIGGYPIGRVRLIYGFTAHGERLFWDYEMNFVTHSAEDGRLQAMGMTEEQLRHIQMANDGERRSFFRHESLDFQVDYGFH